jgi:hypothetical protein
LTGDATGQDSITSYEIYWDYGTNGATYVLLYTSSSPTFDSYTYTYTDPGIVAGTSYLLKYRARNQQGAGSFSATTTIRAAAVPGTPAAVTTSISGTNVLVDWTAPSSHGLTITKYKVTYKYGSTYVELSAYCDGTDVDVIANTQCSVPLSVFGYSPFYLAVGDLVVARVQAYNSLGWGSNSADNTAGATYSTAPTAAVTSLARGSATSKTAIQLTWTGVTTSPSNGGLTADYQVYWNQGSSVNTWV